MTELLEILIKILVGANLIVAIFVQIWVGAYFMGKVLRGGR